jgi:tripartite ATP-independent transporter DctM subunit
MSSQTLTVPQPGERKSIPAKIEDNVCNIVLILIALFPAAEAVLRFLSGIFFGFNIRVPNGVPGSSEIVTHLLLAAGIIAGMIATREKEHLSIGLIQYITNKKIKAGLLTITNMLSAFITTILVFCSAVFVKITLSPGGSEQRMIGFIPEQIFSFVLPLGFAIMAYRFARAASANRKGIALSILPVVIGLVCSIPMFLKFIWELDLPDFAGDISNYFVSAADFVKIPVIIFIVVLALAGTPLFIVIVALSLILYESEAIPVDAIITNVNISFTQSDFVAIPLFSLVGFFLSESKAGERLVETFKSFFGWFSGGMIIITVFLCAFFTTFTGASGVTILALGGILYSILSEKASYPQKFSIGLLTSSGSVGLLFPPSLPIILVGVTMQQNLLKYFAAGIIPGFLLIAAMVVFGIFVSVKTKIPVEHFSIKRAARSVKNSFFEILLPVLLLTGFFSGKLLLIEIGAAALIYVFIVEVFITHDIALRDVYKVFAKAVPIIGGILSIIAVSKALSDYIVSTQAPEIFARWLQTAITSKYLFLLILNLALLVVGCLMDIFSATMVVLPLIIPLGLAYGVNPIHLGIIFLINLETGFLTPPVGLNLFLSSYRFKKPFVEICRAVLPFLLIQLVVVLLVTYIPELSTLLPGILFAE